MKIEDLIGRRFHTKIDKNKVDIYIIEKVNGFGKVVLSLDGKDFDYKTPEYVLRLINEGTWILVEEESKHPSLKQIEELYKNAQFITCAKTGVRYDIYYPLLITETNRGLYNHNESMFCLYDKETKVFASYTPCEEVSKESVNINKTPFYLDEYIHNNDADKREEAKHKNTQKISELPQSIDWLKPVESSEGVFSNMSVSEFIESKFLRRHKILKDPIKTEETEQIKITKSDSSEFTEGHLLKTLVELDFDIEIQSTMQKIQQLLLVKGKEYRRNNNPYHNFEVAARKKNITPEKALDGFLLKHLVSYDDMLNDIEQGVLPKIEVVEEKFNDIICYMIIQKAQILNRIKNEKN